MRYYYCIYLHILSNPWAKLYWLFVESRTPPGYWSVGFSSGSLQSRKRAHYMPQRPPCLAAGLLQWAEPSGHRPPGPSLEDWLSQSRTWASTFSWSHFWGLLPPQCLWFSPCHGFGRQKKTAGEWRTCFSILHLWYLSTTGHTGHV